MLRKVLGTVVFLLALVAAAFGAKTVFIDGDPANGVKGTRVTAAFLNAVNNHDHHGTDADGSNAQLSNADIATTAAISKSKISASGTWSKTDLPATTVYSDQSYTNPAWIGGLDGSKITGTVPAATNAVYAATSGSSMSYGTTLALNNVYQASQDIIVYGYVTFGSTPSSITTYSDGSNPPTTIAQLDSVSDHVNSYSFCFPVKKNDYWKVVTSGSISASIVRTMNVGS